MTEWRYVVSGIVVGTNELKILAIPDEMAALLYDLLDSGVPYAKLAKDDVKSYCRLEAFAYLEVKRVPADQSPVTFIGG